MSKRPISVDELARASTLNAEELLENAGFAEVDSTPSELAPSAEGVSLFDPKRRANGHGAASSVIFRLARHVSMKREPNDTNGTSNGAPDRGNGGPEQ